MPIDIHVERTRAGRTYTSRRVDVRQEGKTIFAMLASFHADEPGREFDHPMPEEHPGSRLAGPDSRHRMASRRRSAHVDVRQPDPAVVGPRFRRRIRAEPVMHFCGLLYASDMRAGGAALAAIGVRIPARPRTQPSGSAVGNIGSLDHALWFHRTPLRSTNGSSVMCAPSPFGIREDWSSGRMFDAGKARHLATFTQEMFLKLEGDG